MLTTEAIAKPRVRQPKVSPEQVLLEEAVWPLGTTPPINKRPERELPEGFIDGGLHFPHEVISYPWSPDLRRAIAEWADSQEFADKLFDGLEDNTIMTVTGVPPASMTKLKELLGKKKLPLLLFDCDEAQDFPEIDMPSGEPGIYFHPSLLDKPWWHLLWGCIRRRTVPGAQEVTAKLEAGEVGALHGLSDHSIRKFFGEVNEANLPLTFRDQRSGLVGRFPYKNWARVKSALVRTFDPRNATGHQVKAMVAVGWPEG